MIIELKSLAKSSLVLCLIDQCVMLNYPVDMDQLIQRLHSSHQSLILISLKKSAFQLHAQR